MNTPQNPGEYALPTTYQFGILQHLQADASQQGVAKPPILHLESVQPEQVTPAQSEFSYLAQTELRLDDTQKTRLQKLGGWVSRHTLALGIGLSAAGLAYSVNNSSYDQAAEGIKANVMAGRTLVGVGIAGEVAFMAGAIMAGIGAGKIRSAREWSSAPKQIKNLEIADTNVNEKLFKRGMTLNIIGAIATPAALAVGAGVMLPREAFWGVAAAAGADVIATVGSRRLMMHRFNQKISTLKGLDVNAKQERNNKLITREATSTDIASIVELDLKKYPKDGERIRTYEEVEEMMRTRFENVNENQGGKMFVQQKDGNVVAFITAFRTNKPAEEFVSWEDSTGDGTLNDKVEPDGEYVYIANMTVDDEGNKEIIMGALLSWGIKAGIEYGYFEARMPGFNGWASDHLADQGKTWEDLSESERDNLAEYYRYLEREDGKLSDWQVRMYQDIPGFSVGPARKNAFKDEESLNYGIMCKAHVPLWDKPSVVRRAASGALKFALRFPKLLEKVF